MNMPADRQPAIPAPRAEAGSTVLRPRDTADHPLRQTRTIAPTSNGVPNALDLLKALRHRWMLALTLGLLCSAVAAGVTWKVLPASEYTAQTLLIVKEQRPFYIFETGEQRVNFSTYQQTELTMLKSREVLNTALRNEAVVALKLDERYPDPIAWIEEKIQANYRGEVLRIAMSGPNPNEVAVLVNAVTDAYLSEHVYKDEAERWKNHEELKRIQVDYQTRLEKKRKELKTLADQLGSSDRETLQFSQQLALERRAIALQDLTQYERDLERLRIQLAVRQETLPASRSTVGSLGASLEAELAQDPTIQQYDSQIASWRDRLEQRQRVIRRPSDPSIRDVERAIGQLEAGREEYVSQLRAQLSQRPRGYVGSEGGGESIVALKEQIQVLEELKHLALSQVEGMDVENRQLGEDTWMLDRIRDDLEQIEIKAKQVSDKVEALNVELTAPARVQPAERAENPRLQNDKRPKMAGMAGFGAFGMALLGIALLEYRTRRIHTVESIISDLQLRLVGALPALPVRRGRNVVADDESNLRWRSVLLESVDAMRTLLLRASTTDAVRSVMITSAVAAEGKTSLASHLATSLARSGRRTLLVDCDLRKPDAHRLFDVAEGPGLSELLRGEVEFDGAIHPSPAADLWILPAGLVDERAIQSLSQPGAEAIFGQLREQFDFVVVDTAPVLPVADALLIGQYVDGAIYSVLRSTSRIPKVQAAADRLRSVGVPILGAVMTGVHGDLYGSQYPYAYSYPGSAATQAAPSE